MGEIMETEERVALTAQNPAVRRGSFHDRMRTMCFAKAATPTTCKGLLWVAVGGT